jgi:predicted CoA-binding protein
MAPEASPGLGRARERTNMEGCWMPVTTDEGIIEVMQNTKTIALVGASNNPDRASYAVLRYLLDLGYTIYPVNPMEEEVFGMKSYASVKDVPRPVDMVDIFRKSEDAAPIVDEAVEIGAKYVWLQLDIFADEQVARAEAAGLKCVVDKCPAIEMPRLYIGPENPHKRSRRRAREAAEAAEAAAKAEAARAGEPVAAHA